MTIEGGFTPRTPICPACGVVAPVHAETCASCARPLAKPRTFAPETGSIAWAAVRAAFTCRACGFPSPLDGLVVADGVACAQCGSYQRFDPSAWSDALGVAHAVADLGGPSPEGRSPNAAVWIGDANPHAAIGMTKTFATHAHAGLTIEASPGFPVCVRCAGLLDVHPEPGGAITRCARCGATARYVLPPSAGTFTTTARAIVAEEQRTDRLDARVSDAGAGGDAGLVALTCPQCGAAVRATDGQTVECTYCRTVAFVPPRARPRGGGNRAKPIVFWIAFDGPSPERLALETPKAPSVAVAAKRVKGFFSRGLAPLPGIDLADRRPGLDVKQLLLTVSFAAVAMAIGYAIFVATNG